MTTPTVLVVDDDPAITALLTDMLEDRGYRVLTAMDGAALQVAHEAQPDVILLDLMMPRVDGREVSRRLRADPATATIPIVAMSAHDRLATVTGTLAVNDRLTKPFHFGDLFAVVARWTGGRPAGRSG